jgi:hypothetical protein
MTEGDYLRRVKINKDFLKNTMKINFSTKRFAKFFSTFFSLAALVFGVSPAANAQYVCQIGGAPVIINGSLNVGDVQQAGRITRDGKPSSCTGDSAVLENNTALRRDTHNLANPYNENVCVTVEVDFTGCGGNQTQAAAYSSYNPAFPASNVIGDMGYSTINRGSFSFGVGPNAPFSLVVNEIDANSGCPVYQLKVTYRRNCRQTGFDRTNDGRADITVYRPSAVSNWYSLDSENNNAFVARQFGTVGDIVTGGSDYTGDGQTDLSVYRPSINSWIYGSDQNAPGTNFTVVQWGAAGDVRVPGDYDGDGKNDFAVYRAAEGNWYVLRSSDGAFQARDWGGQANDIPVSGDFDGDLKTDFAVVRQTLNGSQWFILKSNYNYGFTTYAQWGVPTDKLVPADYDGDSVTDLAVWRPADGTFYVRRSSDLQLQAAKWGTSGDIPQPADYDGDKLHDFAVWRPSNGTWYIIQSETGTFRFQQFGAQGDQPISAPYRIQ